MKLAQQIARTSDSSDVAYFAENFWLMSIVLYMESRSQVQRVASLSWLVLRYRYYQDHVFYLAALGKDAVLMARLWSPIALNRYCMSS